MRCAYLLGPSSCGKSALARLAKERVGVGHIDVDHAFRPAVRNWPALAPVLRCIEESPTGEIVLVDLGAGTQDQTGLAGFIEGRAGRSILVTDLPEVAWRRNEDLFDFGRSFEEYRRAEYEDREPLYRLALHRLNVDGRDLEEAWAVFESMLSQVFETAS